MRYDKLSPHEYRQRDYRVRCLVCGRWMRRKPKPGSGYATRRPPPHAGRCTDCPWSSTKIS